MVTYSILKVHDVLASIFKSYLAPRCNSLQMQDNIFAAMDQYNQLIPLYSIS